MCVNYIPIPKRLVVSDFSALEPQADWLDEVWQDYAAPMIVHGRQGRQAVVANYGFLPKAKLPQGARYSTMNARAETIAQLKSYQAAWQRGQLCLLPMLGFFEPCYESGRAVRHRIGLVNHAPFAVAGLWRAWDEGNGRRSYSFTQITINADEHPLMKRMHKPDDEKRNLVIIGAADYDDWLSCKDPERARSFLRNYPAELMHAQASPKISQNLQQGQQQTLF